jgi:hypothetical protein
MGQAADPHKPASASPSIGKAIAATLAKVPRVALISVVGPLMLLVLSYVLWITYGAKHLDRTQYGLREENLLLTPPPAWIRSDVRKEVFTGSRLDRLNTLDNQMGSVVFDAFRKHPWIRKVFNVGKLSGRDIKVLVEYREPLAMIYEQALGQSTPQSRSVENGGSKTPSTELVSGKTSNPSAKPSPHFFPVDVDGVLLPTKDFLPEQIPNYFLVYSQGSLLQGKKFGADYGDVRVKEALLLCRVLKTDREPLGLERIYVYPDETEGPMAHCRLEITTRSGKTILWGHAPGLEEPGEPGAPAKQRKLREILLNHESPDANATEIDLVDKAKARLGEAFSGLLRN